MKLDVSAVSGRRPKAGTVDLPDDLFGIEPNVAVMHQVVTAQLAHRPRRHAQHQDPGRGRRRRREAVAPEGHRPRPPGLDPRAALAWRRDRPRPEAARLPQRTPKKMVRLALRSALSDRAAESRVMVVDGWGIDEPRTKDAIEVLEALGLRTAGRARRRACSSCSTAARTRCGSRSATSASGCRSSSPRSSTPTTCSSTTGSCSARRRSRPRSRASRAERRRRSPSGRRPDAGASRGADDR